MLDFNGKALECTFCLCFPEAALSWNRYCIKNEKVMTLEIFSGMVFANNKRQGSTDNKYGAFD